jgi:hypothetical protein
MPESQSKKSTTPPAILIVIAVVIMLIGVGRCGFLQPMIHPVMDDYGFGGACCLVLGLALLITGFVWLTTRRRS